jgi:DNA-binding response OmpR family regulator
MSKRILCIDDEEDILACIEFILEDEGYTVRAELSPEQLFFIIRDFKPDLILLDINLCEFNGLQVCKDLSENAETRNIPVIMVSSDDRVFKAQQYGAIDFILKPFNINHLTRTVNKHLKDQNPPSIRTFGEEEVS